MTKNKKTEHAGAKNGGGHWGSREEAKDLSKIARRKDSANLIKNEIQSLSPIDHPTPYFKLNKKEFADALHTLDSLSSELDDYNISYSYDQRLNEAPENPEDMNLYADVLIAHSRIEFEKPKSERNWQQIAKSLGMAGSLRKMTGQLEDAERLLQFSLQIIAKKNLQQTIYVQQSIRLFDLYKRLNRYQESLEGLSNLIDLCSKNESLLYYLDVALQHLGKTQFASENYQDALGSFQKALELRTKKQDKELIESSETAIEVCLLKIRQHT